MLSVREEKSTNVKVSLVIDDTKTFKTVSLILLVPFLRRLLLAYQVIGSKRSFELKKLVSRPVLSSFIKSRYKDKTFKNAKTLWSLKMFFSIDLTNGQRETRKKLSKRISHWIGVIWKVFFYKRKSPFRDNDYYDWSSIEKLLVEKSGDG